jgi:hypothetical protein
MKKLILLLAITFSTSLFSQEEVNLWDFVGSWAYPEGLNIFTFYPESDTIKVKLYQQKTLGMLLTWTFWKLQGDSLITELHTPRNNWYVKKVFYIKNNTLIAKTTGSSNNVEYFKKI